MRLKTIERTQRSFDEIQRGINFDDNAKTPSASRHLGIIQMRKMTSIEHWKEEKKIKLRDFTETKISWQYIFRRFRPQILTHI